MESVVSAPRSVRRAMILLYFFCGVSAAVSLATVLLQLSAPMAPEDAGLGLDSALSVSSALMAPLTIFFVAMSLASRVYLIRLAGVGRNWARLMLAIDCGLNVMGFFPWVAMARPGGAEAVVWAALSLVYCVPIYLLYSTHASVWFRESRRVKVGG